ncbi:serine-threonine protein kinase [Streptomyces sp. WI04-05B]|uniref:serine-threonine protein kinase n=1 Tax=Streptomyces TaxID=1883 RepID=UPI0029B8E7E2|nr:MULTISPECIES: serine-threonine protein kinase [unclassified Streptomyces]MDX2540984.1 serine-threonine protein kinase [Streptomyces sp. WI04-05B]MDX2586101.1 serine-threonine protein kinase [Streptomyces sp. WI04-05A]
MADPEMSVSPYWELTFDADGDADGRERERLLAEVKARKVRDLIVFAHGWNNDRSMATRLYSRFFEAVPALAPATARIGYAGVVWPSMRFTDEPIPDFQRSLTATALPEATGRPGLDKDTRHALLETFPGRATLVEQIAGLLDRQPGHDEALEEFGGLVRLLVEVEPEAPQTGFAADLLLSGGEPEGAPEMFAGSTAEVCEEFARALSGPESPDAVAEFALPNPWNGAKELLRQATYYAMKRRAGTVGERGLGPALGRLAEAAPGVRVHLVGHSFGARLVSFALSGLPEGVRTVKSVTLLQGAFSHYAFAAQLPHDTRGGGALKGRQNRIDGPLVCCYSRYDGALSTFYPLASRMAGESRGVLAADRSVSGFTVADALGPEWGAMGHDGVQAVPGTVGLTIAEALGAGKLPVRGCVNVDAAAVVRNGGAPSGAHSDICHSELAQVVLAAGRVH